MESSLKSEFGRSHLNMVGKHGTKKGDLMYGLDGKVRVFGYMYLCKYLLLCTIYTCLLYTNQILN